MAVDPPPPIEIHEHLKYFGVFEVEERLLFALRTIAWRWVALLTGLTEKQSLTFFHCMLHSCRISQAQLFNSRVTEKPGAIGPHHSSAPAAHQNEGADRVKRGGVPGERVAHRSCG